MWEHPEQKIKGNPNRARHFGSFTSTFHYLIPFFSFVAKILGTTWHDRSKLF